MSRADTERIHTIWWVRGTLGARGLLALTGNPVNPADDRGLRDLLIAAANWMCRPGEFADTRGIVRHAPGQLAGEPKADVYSWDQVWQLIAPGITDERVAELVAAWHSGRKRRARSGEHTDDRLHRAVCAFFDPAPSVQLDLFDLIGAAS